MTGVSNYYEKQEAKSERFRELENKHKVKSEALWNRSDKIVENIPLGQPILVGHHSEKTHRNLLKRCHNAMNQSIEESKKSEYYKDKAESAENNTAISSDAPDAIERLKDKLNNLETQRNKIKEYNKNAKKNNKEPYRSYVLTNLGANIRTVKKRIKNLNALDKKETEEVQIGDIKIINNKEDNRTQIFFPEKPNEEIRTKLKSNGFRWSPYNGCWQRNFGSWSYRLAKDIITDLKEGERK